MRKEIKFYFFRGYSDSRNLSNCLPEDVFDECVRRWPQFKKAGHVSFNVEVELGSDLAVSIIEFIRVRAGKEPDWKLFPSVYKEKGRYNISGRRVFEQNEIEKADYCWCIPKKTITKSGYRHDDGILEVERGSIMAQSIGSTISGFTVLCTDSIRLEIQKEGFLNIGFRNVKVSGKKPPKEPLWEIYGQSSLPAVTNKLVNDQGENSDDSARGCWIDDLFFPPILEYNEESLANEVGAFDVASTVEKWHSGVIARRAPFLICSKRFRLWCQDHGFKLDWVPVVSDL